MATHCSLDCWFMELAICVSLPNWMRFKPHCKWPCIAAQFHPYTIHIGRLYTPTTSGIVCYKGCYCHCTQHHLDQAMPCFAHLASLSFKYTTTPPFSYQSLNPLIEQMEVITIDWFEGQFPMHDFFQAVTWHQHNTYQQPVQHYATSTGNCQQGTGCSFGQESCIC